MTDIISESLMNMMHPGFIMIGSAILMLLLPDSFRKPITLVAPIVAAFGLFNIPHGISLEHTVGNFITIKYMYVDGLTYAFMLAFCAISILAAIYSYEVQGKLESAMALIYAGSMMSVVMSGGFISLIVFWEIAAIASTYLVYARHTVKSRGAAFRYLLMHAFGGNFLLVGLLIYIFNYGNNIENIMHSYGHPAFWMILIGVAVNAAIPPLSSWLSDTYPEATIGGTVYLGSFTTKAAIYVMIRLFAGWEVLLWVGAVMALYGACMAIMENDIRRLLSYHIVSQLGMMIVAIGCGGIAGINGATAHAITNIIFKGILLMAAGTIIYSTGKSKITELSGLAKKMPFTATCFLISSLAIAGLPGLSGFVSKALVTDAVAATGNSVIGVLLTMAGVGTLLSITLKINYYVFFCTPEEKTDSINVQEPLWSMRIAMIAGTIISIGIGLLPAQFYSIMPEVTAVNPYTLSHVLEYVAIFIGGSIPFIIFLEKMKPHDEYTLDFDWFYRKFLNALVKWLSAVLISAFSWTEKVITGGVSYIGKRLSNPYLIINNSKNEKVRSYSFENEDMPIGHAILAIIFAFAVMIIAVSVMV